MTNAAYESTLNLFESDFCVRLQAFDMYLEGIRYVFGISFRMNCLELKASIEY